MSRLHRIFVLPFVPVALGVVLCGCDDPGSQVGRIDATAWSDASSDGPSAGTDAMRDSSIDAAEPCGVVDTDGDGIGDACDDDDDNDGVTDDFDPLPLDPDICGDIPCPIPNCWACIWNRWECVRGAQGLYDFCP